MKKLQMLFDHQQICFRKIKYGETVVGGVGKFNGSVIQRGRYGYIQRVKVSPVNPQSTDQQTQRGTFSGLSSAWRDLTDAQRATWINGAGDFPYRDWFGDSQVLSGNALFVKLNTVLANLGIAQNDTLPAAVAVPLVTATSITAAAGAGTIALVFTPSPVPADTQMVVYATPNLSPGVNFFKNKFRIITRIAAAAATPQAIGAAYVAKFGAMTAGKKIAVRIVNASELTGQVGISTEAVDIIAA